MSKQNYGYVEPPVLSAELIFKAAKRALDLAGALILLVALFPVFTLTAILLKLDSPGPILFRQWRIGLGGRPFRMLKFRSMVPGSEEELNNYLENDPVHRLNWEQFQKLWHDPRLTRMGTLLRRLSLDELPQLWNVLRGEMSLVGPRPILPEQRRIYGESLPIYMSVRPGMTGLWQVNGRNLTSFMERVRWDICYVNNWSLWLDLQILYRTVATVWRGEGAF